LAARRKVSVQGFDRLMTMHDTDVSLRNQTAQLPRQFQIERGAAREAYKVCTRTAKVIFEFAAAGRRKRQFKSARTRSAAHVEKKRLRAAATERIE
jgi:hypothetical protein